MTSPDPAMTKWLLKRQVAAADPRLSQIAPDGRRLYRISSGVVVRAYPLGKSIRRKVRDRDGDHCSWCGSTEKTQIDHIIPYVDGGPNTMENLRVLCQQCNTERGRRT